MKDSSEHSYTTNITPFPSLVMRLVFALAIFVSGALVGKFWKGSALSVAEPDTECIPPEFRLAFPVWQPAMEPETGTTKMPESWKPQLNSPDIRIDRPSHIFTKDNNEVWLLTPDGKILRIDLAEHLIDEVRLSFNEQADFSVSLLHMTASGKIVALGTMRQTTTNIISLFVAEYSEENRTFEVVAKHYEERSGSYVSLIETPNGDIWTLLGSALWRVDPNEWKITRILGRREGYVFLDLEQDRLGNLWLVFELTPAEVEERGILYQVNTRYIMSRNLETGEIHEYWSPPNLQKYRTGNQPGFDIFVDEEARIWASHYGWLTVEESGEAQWYEVIRSPIFITGHNTGAYKYAWLTPTPVLQTDGRYIWFTSGAGIARLDLKTEDWCLLNRLWTIALTVDDSGRIWTAAEGQIYVYDPHDD